MTEEKNELDSLKDRTIRNIERLDKHRERIEDLEDKVNEIIQYLHKI